MILFLVLSTLYIALIFYIFEKSQKSTCFYFYFDLSFVDDGFLIFQEKSTAKSNANIFSSYNIISSLFNNFGLKIEYDKLEIFHFSRAIKILISYPLILVY